MKPALALSSPSCYRCNSQSGGQLTWGRGGHGCSLLVCHRCMSLRRIQHMLSSSALSSPARTAATTVLGELYGLLACQASPGLTIPKADIPTTPPGHCFRCGQTAAYFRVTTKRGHPEGMCCTCWYIHRIRVLAQRIDDSWYQWGMVRNTLSRLVKNMQGYTHVGAHPSVLETVDHITDLPLLQPDEQPGGGAAAGGALYPSHDMKGARNAVHDDRLLMAPLTPPTP